MSEIDYEAPLAPRDYATARRIVASDYSDERRELEIMAALSSERAKARAPFLAVADEVHRRGVAEVAAMDDEPDEHRRNQCASRAATYARAEHLIRAAAQDSP